MDLWNIGVKLERWLGEWPRVPIDEPLASLVARTQRRHALVGVENLAQIGALRVKLALCARAAANEVPHAAPIVVVMPRSHFDSRGREQDALIRTKEGIVTRVIDEDAELFRDYQRRVEALVDRESKGKWRVTDWLYTHAIFRDRPVEASPEAAVSVRLGPSGL